VVAAYDPHPVDTSAVDLPPELLTLLDRLAEHNHDVWARQRVVDGWRLGPARNDELKEHPSLVPFAELPESEKNYDRVLASETLKLILLLGYRVVPGDSKLG
jgi:hypothetical protein